MGEARRRRLADKGPSGREALAAYVDRLRTSGRAADHRLREQGQRPGRKLVAAELVPIAAALLDPALGPGTLDAILASFAAAHGVGDGALMCEYGTCRALWTPERIPRAALVIRVLEPEALRLAFLCEACACGPMPEVRARVRAMMLADFLGGEGEEVAMAPEVGTA